VDVAFEDGATRIAVAGFREGVFFGRTPISFCPATIRVQEQVEDGWKQLVALRRRDVQCKPSHRWSIPLIMADGRPLFSVYKPRGLIDVAITTETSEVAGSGSMPPPK
jgi:metal-sulfur cluster biosynthetic enzyme